MSASFFVWCRVSGRPRTASGSVSSGHWFDGMAGLECLGPNDVVRRLVPGPLLETDGWLGGRQLSSAASPWHELE